jgi:hypothetical protein
MHEEYSFKSLRKKRNYPEYRMVIPQDVILMYNQQIVLLLEIQLKQRIY